MEKRYYSGLTLEKDLKFCEIVKALESKKNVFIYSKGNQVEVIEMELDHMLRRKPTGKTHVGYEFHYVSFFYFGWFFTIEPATYYPFTDENNPGEFNFVAYDRVGHTHAKQATYRMPYKDFNSIVKWLHADRLNAERIRNAPTKRLFLQVTETDERIIDKFVKNAGGFREQEIWALDPMIIPTDTWNDDHKVVDVVVMMSDRKGHRDSFEFDLVTKIFCG